MITPRLISVIKTPVKVKISHQQLVNVKRHLNVFEPAKKFPLTNICVGGINIRKDSGVIIVVRTKLNREAVFILENLRAREKIRFPNNNWATRSTYGGNVFKSNRTKVSDKLMVKRLLFSFLKTNNVIGTFYYSIPNSFPFLVWIKTPYIPT